MSGLPEGWDRCSLDEINDPDRPICYGILMPGPDRPGGIPYVKVRNIRGGRILLDEVHRTSPEIDAKYARSRLRGNDLLVSIRGTFGRTASVPAELDGGNITQDTARVAPVGVNPEYVLRFLESPQAQGYFKAVARGVAVKGVNIGDLRRLSVDIPPHAEQQRIVTAVDEAFCKLDVGEAGLRRVRQRLKRMRDAVLAGAVTGRLVPQDNTDTPAAKVLADLGTEVGDAAALPSGWAFASLDDAVGRDAITDGPFGSNLKSSHYRDTGPRVIRLQNVGDGEFRDQHAHIEMEHFIRLSKHEVEAGDVVVASLGEILPRACLAPEWLGPAIVKADCIRIRPGRALIGKYLMYALNSQPVRASVAESIKGVGRPRMNLGDLRRLHLPLPPIEEQRRIVEEVDRRLSFIEACERAVDLGLVRSSALRRSTLKAAFEGRLVPQDPTEDPAAVLLQRIRDGRSASGPSSARRRGRKVPPS